MGTLWGLLLSPPQGREREPGPGGSRPPSTSCPSPPPVPIPWSGGCGGVHLDWSRGEMMRGCGREPGGGRPCKVGPEPGGSWRGPGRAQRPQLGSPDPLLPPSGTCFSICSLSLSPLPWRWEPPPPTPNPWHLVHRRRHSPLQLSPANGPGTGQGPGSQYRPSPGGCSQGQCGFKKRFERSLHQRLRGAGDPTRVERDLG